MGLRSGLGTMLAGMRWGIAPAALCLCRTCLAVTAIHNTHQEHECGVLLLVKRKARYMSPPHPTTALRAVPNFASVRPNMFEIDHIA